MRGLEALLKIRSVEEKKAQRSLAQARGEFERLLVLERNTYETCRKVQQKIKDLESKDFEVREALSHRRYLNSLRNRFMRLREARIAAQAKFEEERKKFEEAKHKKEAVQMLIEKRRSVELKKKRRREEKILEDAMQLSLIHI